MGNKQIVNTNILIKYPVHWTEYTVMNNFVQNFYDAIGPESFSEAFHHKYSDGTIYMESDIGFSKEWLYFMGASSKRNTDNAYAGRFGEGFKIASLVGYRDYGLDISMESQDWRITVSEGEIAVAGVNEKVLQYVVEERPYKNNTLLVLKGATQKIYEIMKYEMEQFYYENNPQFERLISKGDGFAVFRARAGRSGDTKGGVFVNLQKRGVFHYPVFFCNHKYDVLGDDRDREYLSNSELMKVIVSVVKKIDARVALEILEMFRPVWWGYHDRKWNGNDWKKVLTELICVIKHDKDVLTEFLNRYKNSIVVDVATEYTNNYQRGVALIWFSRSEFSKRSKVGNIFAELGIDSIYGLCKENGGFVCEREAFGTEIKKIELLEKVAGKYFSDIYCYDELPKCVVLTNKNAIVLGQALSLIEKRRLFNKKGLKVKRRIETVYLLDSILDEGTFSEVLPVYLHELLHQFGGDSSVAFHQALRDMNEVFLKKVEVISKYEECWKTIS